MPTNATSGVILVRPEEPSVFITETETGPRPVEGVATSITAFVGGTDSGRTHEPVPIGSFADFERDFGGLSLSSPLGYAVRDFFLNGGSRAVVVRVDGELVGPGMEEERRGLYALEKVDLFNLLCLPTSGVDPDASALGEAAAYCERRRAMLLVDPPVTWTTTSAAREGVGALGTSANAAVYFPRLRQPDPLSGNRLTDFAPCGAVAGVMARIDTARGVWKAPAGLEAELRGVPALSQQLTDVDNRELNPRGVNCLRDMPGTGPVVWGARTLQGDDRLASEWKYVPVRRTALFIEESLDRGTRWATFEPNAEPLWAQVRLTVVAFMHALFRQGAFQGRSPHEGYYVRCDPNTMTQNDIDNGRLVVEVGFAPIKPAEFVVLRITQQCVAAG